MPSRSRLAVPIDGEGSEPQMEANTLGERVIAARSSRSMNASRLQKATGLSARTVRDIESGNPHRRYSPTTLGRLDGPLGWSPGTAWRLWTEQAHPVGTAELERSIEEVARRVAMLEEEPPWARELVDLVRVLAAEDRHRMIDLARRLGA